MNEQRIPVSQENAELRIPVLSESNSTNVELSREASIIRGVDGISPIAYVEQTTTGATITVTDASGTTTANISNGERGEQGERGPRGETGATGAAGTNGRAATVSVGSVTTGNPGTNASVTNSGSTSDAILNFVIPRGSTGATGPAGQNGQDGYSPTATVVKNGDTATITITDKNGTTTASISDGSGAAVTVDSALSSTSENPVQNKVINSALSSKADSSDIPTKTSELTNDSGFITSSDLPTDYVTTDTDQDITGVKTFKSVVNVQNGQGTGALWVGGDVNAAGATNNTRHLARIVAPSYANASLGATMLGFDTSGDSDMHVSNKTYDVVSFGGMKKITNATSPMAIGFCVTNTRNATAAANKVYPLEMDATSARFNVQPNYNGTSLVADSSYIHTDNNFTSTYKNRLDTLTDSYIKSLIEDGTEVSY